VLHAQYEGFALFGRQFLQRELQPPALLELAEHTFRTFAVRRVEGAEDVLGLLRTGLWALDLQNVTNTRNEAFRYFDARQGKVVTQLQLGLIPNISYRIEF